MSERLHIFAYKVYVSQLPDALKAMNQRSDHFRSRVTNVIPSPGNKTATVLVEHTNDYPYITNQWEQWVLP